MGSLDDFMDRIECVEADVAFLLEEIEVLKNRVIFEDRTIPYEPEMSDDIQVLQRLIGQFECIKDVIESNNDTEELLYGT